MVILFQTCIKFFILLSTKPIQGKILLIIFLYFSETLKYYVLNDFYNKLGVPGEKRAAVLTCESGESRKVKDRAYQGRAQTPPRPWRLHKGENTSTDTQHKSV